MKIKKLKWWFYLSLKKMSILLLKQKIIIIYQKYSYLVKHNHIFTSDSDLSQRKSKNYHKYNMKNYIRARKKLAISEKII